MDEVRLLRGDELLGVIAVSHVDQPFVHGRFAATATFEGLRPLFEEELRLLEASAPQADMEAWAAAYDRIQALGLRLRFGDGIEATEFLLHVDGQRAWFRH